MKQMKRVYVKPQSRVVFLKMAESCMLQHSVQLNSENDAKLYRNQITFTEDLDNGWEVASREDRWGDVYDE